MPYAEVVGRIQEIQATIAQFSPRATVSTATAASTSTSSTAAATVSASAFSAALDGAAATTPTPTAQTGQATGADIVAAAKKYIGVPYVFGGEDRSGMDCSGLVQTTLADVGIKAPRVVSQQQYIGTKVDSLKDAKPGDLIITHNADHVVIYAGNGMIIHAPYPGRDVCLKKNYLTDADIQTIRRVAPEAAPVTAKPASSPSSAAATLLPSSLTTSLSSGTAGTGDLAAMLQSYAESATGSGGSGGSVSMTDIIASARLSQLSLFSGQA